MGNYEGFVGFLTDDEKLEYLMDISGHSPEVYRHRYTIKIYEGAELLIYHFNSKGLLTYDTVLVCTGFVLTDRDMSATFIERKNFKVFTVRDVPNRVADLDLLTCMPVRCKVERTMKITRAGKKISGVAASILVQSKSHPEQRVTNHCQMIPLTQTHQRFSQIEWSQAESRAAMSA